jgi:ABC-2 type transport system permease protein
MRLRSEETALRVEPLLATAVGRVTWAFSHITMTLVGTTTLLLGAGLGGGVVYGAQTHDMGQIGHVLGGALVQLPAVWVVTSIVVAAFGLAPRLVVIGWAALAVFLLLGELGPVLKPAQWAMDISPFTHVPKIPGADLTAAPMLWLLGVAAALTAAGVIGFRRRDIG